MAHRNIVIIGILLILLRDFLLWFDQRCFQLTAIIIKKKIEKHNLLLKQIFSLFHVLVDCHLFYYELVITLGSLSQRSVLNLGNSYDSKVRIV